eukprot:UC4_evm6s379
MVSILSVIVVVKLLAIFSSDISIPLVRNPPEITFRPWDQHGYVLFCPSRNRFGNQADYLLGALTFTAALERTLVLPFPKYETSRAYDSLPRSFTDILRQWYAHDLKALQEKFKVVHIDEFAALAHYNEDAKVIWPVENRRILCSTKGGAPSCVNHNDEFCSRYFRAFGIQIDGIDDSLLLRHSFYAGTRSDLVDLWFSHFPSKTYPVLAFNEPSAPFPLQRQSELPHQFITFESEHMRASRAYLVNSGLRSPYVALHIRNSTEWLLNVCRHIIPNIHARVVMASSQCLEPGEGTRIAMCAPSMSEIKSKALAAVRDGGARSIFIGSDNENSPLLVSKAIRSVLGDDFPIVYLPVNKPQVDLYAFVNSDFFVGNCVSTFTSFARRSRNTRDKKFQTAFFGKPFTFEKIPTNAATTEKSEL